MQDDFSRRRLMELAVLWQSAAVASGKPRAWKILTSEEAGEIEAIAAQIIPSDATAGAREAGVIHFIDYALATFDRHKRQAYRDGLQMAQTRRRELFPDSTSVATLSGADQQRLLTSIETTPFFEMVRAHTIMGFLGNPEYGGNQGKTGWKLIGFEDGHGGEPHR